MPSGSLGPGYYCHVATFTTGLLAARHHSVLHLLCGAGLSIFRRAYPGLPFGTMHGGPLLELEGIAGSSLGGSARDGLGAVGDVVVRRGFTSLTTMDCKTQVRLPQYLGDSARHSKCYIRHDIIYTSKPKCPKRSPELHPNEPQCATC